MGFFQNYFGSDKVKEPKHGNEKGFDVFICDEPLSIKTITNDEGIKVIWTVDNDMVDEAIKNYEPSYDLLLVRIKWLEELPSIFYIPTETQKNVMQKIDKEAYLKSNRGTNNRGIELSQLAIRMLKENENTLKEIVSWNKQGLVYSPYDRWHQYWESIE